MVKLVEQIVCGMSRQLPACNLITWLLCPGKSYFSHFARFADIFPNAKYWVILVLVYFAAIVDVITARKRSLRRLCFYRCLSVHRGGMHGCSRGWGACVVAPGGACVVAPGGGGGMHGCSQGACMVCSWGRGACMVALGGCAWLLGGACMVAPKGACVVAPGGCVWLHPGGRGMHPGGHVWYALGGWLFLGGMCGCSGGMCACSGGCMVMLGGMHGCSGACMGYDETTEMRSMSGQYASYWNAFLLSFSLSRTRIWLFSVMVMMANRWSENVNLNLSLFIWICVI